MPDVPDVLVRFAVLLPVAALIVHDIARERRAGEVSHRALTVVPAEPQDRSREVP